MINTEQIYGKLKDTMYMTDHFYWFWIFFLIFPLARIIQRYFRRHSGKKFDKSTENNQEIQFEDGPTHMMEKPIRNLARPETKDMLVLGELNRGAKNFERMLKNTGLDRDDLISILDNLEKEDLIRVEQKSGFLGPKVELFVTDKGFKKYYS